MKRLAAAAALACVAAAAAAAQQPPVPHPGTKLSLDQLRAQMFHVSAGRRLKPKAWPRSMSRRYCWPWKTPRTR